MSKRNEGGWPFLWFGLLMMVIGLVLIVLPSPSKTTAPAPVFPAGCTQMAKTPAVRITKTVVGGTWNGDGLCYNVPKGIALTKPVTVEDARFFDNTPPPVGPSKHSLGMRPIIEVKLDNGVTLKDLTLTGSDTGFLFKAGAVGQAGVDVRSSSNLVIDDVTTNDTWGDGLTLFRSAGKAGVPDNNVQVTNLTVNGAGRDGISPADVTNSTFTNTVITSAKDNGLDFESDLKSVGDSGLQFDGLNEAGGINIIQKVGTLFFENTNAIAGRTYIDSNGSTIYYQGSFLCSRNSPEPCIEVKGGTLNIAAPSSLTHEAGPAKITNIPYVAEVPGVINGLANLEQAAA